MSIATPVTITLNLDSETKARLNERAARRGQDVASYISELATWAAYEDSDEDDNLKPEDITAIRAGIHRGLADGQAGRVKPASQVFANLKARYNIAEL